MGRSEDDRSIAGAGLALQLQRIEFDDEHIRERAMVDCEAAGRRRGLVTSTSGSDTTMVDYREREAWKPFSMAIQGGRLILERVI